MRKGDRQTPDGQVCASSETVLNRKVRSGEGTDITHSHTRMERPWELRGQRWGGMTIRWEGKKTSIL